jgi:hypothetical protein
MCSKEQQILSKEEQSHLDRSRKFHTLNIIIFKENKLNFERTVIDQLNLPLKNYKKK